MDSYDNGKSWIKPRKECEGQPGSYSNAIWGVAVPSPKSGSRYQKADASMQDIMLILPCTWERTENVA